MKEEKIKVLALLPMELPKEIELDNTLEAMQNFVGGLIECITCHLCGKQPAFSKWQRRFLERKELAQPQVLSVLGGNWHSAESL